MRIWLAANDLRGPPLPQFFPADADWIPGRKSPPISIAAKRRFADGKRTKDCLFIGCSMRSVDRCTLTQTNWKPGGNPESHRKRLTLILPMRNRLALEDESVICWRDVPPPSVTSISSGRYGKRDETQVDLAPARVRFNVKTLVGCLLLLIAAGILVFLSRGAAFSNAIFPNADSHNHCKDLPVNDLSR